MKHAGAIAGIVALTLGLAKGAHGTIAEEPYSLERAEAILQQGSDRQEARDILERLGLDGVERAQLLLGAIHLEGKELPRSPVEGYAWLKVAADATDKAVADSAHAMLQKAVVDLSGIELIQGDQRALAVQTSIVEHWYQQYGTGLRHYTDQVPVSIKPIAFAAEVVQLSTPQTSLPKQDFLTGCAATPGKLCRAEAQTIPEPRCTGRILPRDRDVRPPMTNLTYTVAPYYPVQLRRRRVAGHVWLVVHIDRSGFVCSAAVAAGSGEPLLNQAALEAITLWRFNPAMRNGEPIESLHVTKLSFKLQP
jgi:TonB family protein